MVAAVLIAGGFAYAWWVVQRAMPTINGTVKVEGMSAPASVTRDNYGVPHIVASTVEDLYAAQGYVNAQDRLFQMYYYRQLSAGRLAEAFGPAAKTADIFLRTLGMRRAAEADLAATNPEVRKGLEAYTRGVNAFLHTHRDTMPLEFNIAGLTMDDWQPVDTLAFGKVMSYDLSTNWDQEFINADLRAKLGPERAALLENRYPADAPVIVPGSNSGSLTPALQAFNREVRPWLPPASVGGLGSNNWVVDGTKSTTGKPLLSNDPHLGVQSPSIWYQIHLSTSDGSYDAAGFSFAGAPGIITGHNQDITWGVTNVEADVQDLFLEKLDPQNHPGQYLTPEGWKPFQVLTETVKVKGAEDIPLMVRVTRHGPLISDALAAMSSTLGTSITDSVAMQWTALNQGHLIEAIYGLQRARNWQDFRAALSNWTVPGQNFVYADREGNIGYQMTGQLPIRKKGDGKAPVPGSTGEYDWNGFVPFDDLPRAYNPPEHFIATANNKAFGPDYKYPIQAEWAPPYRIDRIRELLLAKDKLGVDDFKAILTDTNSVLPKKLAPVMGKVQPTDAGAQEAARLLQNWNGDLNVDSPEASIYEVTLNRALSDTLRDDLGVDLFDEYVSGSAPGIIQSFAQLFDKPDDPFWDRTDTPAKEKRDDILLSSLNNAVNDLRGAFGDSMSDWTWGKLHTIEPSHVFGSQPVVSGIFNLERLPLGGDSTTVSVGGYSLAQPFYVISHQSYRMIVDTSDWSKSLAIYAGGQSGQPYSKHWGDNYHDWQLGQYHPILYSKQDIDANKEGVLTLTP